MLLQEKKSGKKRGRGESDEEDFFTTQLLKASSAESSEPDAASSEEEKGEPDEDFEEVELPTEESSGVDDDAEQQLAWEIQNLTRPEFSYKTLLKLFEQGGGNWTSFVKRFPRLKTTKVYKRVLSAGRRETEAALDKDARSKTRKKIKTADEPDSIVGAAIAGPSVLKKKKKTSKEMEEEFSRNTTVLIEKKARIRCPTQTNPDVFKVDILRAKQPPLSRLKRQPNLNFVAALKQKIKNAPFATVTPLCFQVIGLPIQPTSTSTRFESTTTMPSAAITPGLRFEICSTAGLQRKRATRFSAHNFVTVIASCSLITSLMRSAGFWAKRITQTTSSEAKCCSWTVSGRPRILITKRTA